MTEAARERGYSYIGITDHSQSLRIARGVSEEDLWQQIRYIDKLNARLKGSGFSNRPRSISSRTGRSTIRTRC